MPERAGAACVVAKSPGDKSVLVEICQQLLQCPLFFCFEYHELALTRQGKISCGRGGHQKH